MVIASTTNFVNKFALSTSCGLILKYFLIKAKWFTLSSDCSKF